MLGFVRALWSVFDRVMPWRRALVLGMAEQGANVLLPAGGAGGPAFGAFVLTKLGVPADLAARRHAALFLITSAVTFVAILFAGMLTTVHLLAHDTGSWRRCCRRSAPRSRSRWPCCSPSEPPREAGRRAHQDGALARAELRHAGVRGPASSSCASAIRC